MAPAESFRATDAPDAHAPAAAVLADAARAMRAGRTRLALLAQDLFQDDALRIDEARRTRMRTVLDGLVRSIEIRIRRGLADRLDPVVPVTVLMALGNMTLPIARPVLDAAGTLADPDLVAVLARCVDEHRLVLQARLAAGQDPELVAQDLFGQMLVHADAGLAAAARAVADLAPVRLGRYEEPAIDLADLPPALAERLVWRVAAAIRHWIDLHDDIPSATLDRAVAAMAASVLVTGKAAIASDGAAVDLARAMLRVGIADDMATVALAIEGHVATAVAGLALRAGVGMAAAWDMVLDPDGARLILLLRAAGMERSAAASLLLRWPDAAASTDRIGDRMAGYDVLPASEAHAAIDLYRLDSGYAAALDALAGGLARR